MTAVSEQAGKALAPQVKKHGPKMVPKSLKESGDGRPSKADGAKFVAGRSAQSMKFYQYIRISVDSLFRSFPTIFLNNLHFFFFFVGYSTVLNSLKTGAKCVCKSFASETTATVEYK